MLSLYQTLSVRYLGRRWFRALLIVASIALGVATLVATQALTETMNRAGLQVSNPLAGTADLLVNGSNDALISLDLTKELLQIKGVRSAHPRVFTKVKLPDLKNRHALLVGIEILGENTKNQPWEITWRNDVSHDKMIYLSEQVAAILKNRDPTKKDFSDIDFKKLQPLISDAKKLLALDWQEMAALSPFGNGMFGLVGKELQREIPANLRLLNVAVPEAKKSDAITLVQMGLIDASGPFAALGGNTIVVEIHSLNALLGWENKAHRIDLVLDPGFDREAIKKEVRSIVNGRAEVQAPDEKNEMIQDVFASMQTGFTLCGAAALVVGLFLVYNVLRFSVAERRHEIGILLSVGATRLQVVLLFAGEAVLLGLAGSLIGIPAGLGLAHLALQPVQDILKDIFMDVHAKQVDVSLQVLALAVAAGIVTAVAAALIPALAAAKENPAEAVRRVPPKSTWRYLTAQIVVSLLFAITGTLCILLREWMPGQMRTFGGMVLVLLGALIAAPLIAAVIARALQPLLRFAAGIEGRLAADNLVRSAARTGIVIAALAAGVALVMMTAGIIRSNRAAYHGWIQQSITADLFVTSGSPVGVGAKGDSMPATLQQDLENMKEIEKAVPIRTGHVVFRNKRVYLTALDASARFAMNEKRSAGEGLYANLAKKKDGVIISENFSFLHRVRTGDDVALSSPRGIVKLKVIGTIKDMSWNFGSLFINRDDYVRHWGDDKVEVFNVFLSAKANPVTVQEKILKLHGAEHALKVQTKGERLTFIDHLIERIYGIAYGQLIVVMCVAALGVITALLISILQRRQEMGMLRAIGASQFQVVHSVLVEAALMGIIGTIIGLLVGVWMEWYVLNIIMREEFGYRYAMHIPWMEALLIAAAAVFLATLAGLGPALYAVRQRIPDAIAYE